MNLVAAGDRAATGQASPVPGRLAARTREAYVSAIAASPHTIAAWECGSASFGRADEASDLDVITICMDGMADVVLDEIETALLALTDEIDIWRAGTTMAGRQRFWHPRGAGTEQMIATDAAVMEHTTHEAIWQEFLQPERHGRALVLHDPDGLLASMRADSQFNAEAHRARIETELQRIERRRILFGNFAEKEFGRGRTLDAEYFLRTMIITPLVSLLGIAYRPLRYDFGMRYLHDELPEPVAQRLTSLIHHSTDLRAASTAGLAWIDELLEQIDIAALPIEAHAAQMRAAFG